MKYIIDITYLKQYICICVGERDVKILGLRSEDRLVSGSLHQKRMLRNFWAGVRDKYQVLDTSRVWN